MVETVLAKVLANVRIVLVEPAGALNVGAIARVMKNMGLHRLVLVNPRCDPLSVAARQMAVHAGDLLEAAEQASTLPAALRGCQRVMATTARARTIETALEPPRTSLPWLLQPAAQLQSALIFGPEDRGLSNTELNYAQRFIRIPSSAVYPALNLAQAVAICCYELYQSAQVLCDGSSTEHEAVPFSSPPRLGRTDLLNLQIESSPSAPLEVLEGYYQQLETMLLKIGYLYPHTTTSRMEKFRRIFNRTQLSRAEVAMLRGILSQVAWALQVNLED